MEILLVDALGVLWTQEHDTIFFDALVSKNEKEILLYAISSTISQEEFQEETIKRFAEVMDTPLHNVFHQNMRRSKKASKKLAKLYDESLVMCVALALDKGVPKAIEA